MTAASQRRKLRAVILQEFSYRGKKLSNEAFARILDVFQEVQGKQSVVQYLKKLVQVVDRVDGEIIREDHINDAVEEIRKQDEFTLMGHVTGDSQIITVDTFRDIHPYSYDTVKRRFAKSATKEHPIASPVECRYEHLRERFQVLYQRILRNPLFTPPPPDAPPSASNRVYIPLCTVEALAANSGEGQERHVLGMLVQPEEGKLALEDINCRIFVDLSQCAQTVGLATLGSFVLAEGFMRDDGVLQVHAMATPPAELREDTFHRFGQLDLFGLRPAEEEMIRLKSSEESDEDAFIVFVSEMYLDKPEVLQKLQILLDGYDQMERPPHAFVFMGNFTSRPFGPRPSDGQTLRAAFDHFAAMLASHANLVEHSTMVFVPGPSDPGVGSVLPRPYLPAPYGTFLKERVPNCVLAANPCRIRYCTQEIVVFREDILNKMRRHCVVEPSPEVEDISEHLVKTLLDQGHLCPLPMPVRPVLWQFDHTLWLYPLPDVLVLGDRSEYFEWKYSQCTAFCPSTFSKDFSFAVYKPHSRDVEYSRIP
eukprot:Rmarinus@m.24782